MKVKINIQVLMMLLLATSITMGGLSGCKSKKKVAEAQAQAEKERMIAKAKTDLLAILNDEGQMTLEQKEEELARIKALNLDDPEIRDLIRQVETRLAEERSAREREVVEEKPVTADIKNVQNLLNTLFDQIATSGSIASENQTINQAMGMFASPEVPVLIIINQQGDVVDYDRPTTIDKYLNYLKDQDKNINKVKEIKTNSSGKVTEVVLIRKYEN